MAKEKEVNLEVDISEGGDVPEVVNIVVKHPNGRVMKEAGQVWTRAWYRYIADKIMTKQQLERFMIENNIWSKDKEKEQDQLVEDIRSLTKNLLQGSARRKRKASEGRDIAIEIKKKRAQLQQLIGEKLSLEANSAESLADNDKFDYIVSECTYGQNGEKVYTDVDDYNEKSDGAIAFAAAAKLAEMLYSLDKDFESQLPENQFLKKFDYVNEDYELVDRTGKRISVDGKNIDKFGFYVNESGDRVDADGNLLDSSGQLSFTAEYTKESKATKTKADGKNVESV